MPNDVIQFLSLDEARAIHERLIEKFGGAPGKRDLGLLESALFRPQTGYYADLAQMSAALFESLIKHHAFIDRNKRAAYFIAMFFCASTGWKLNVDSNDGYPFHCGNHWRKGVC